MHGDALRVIEPTLPERAGLAAGRTVNNGAIRLSLPAVEMHG
jgi:hypothetical protein